jgi:predicted GIY-YIG superfamily endonuclease
MMYFVYILKSDKDSSYYIGATKDVSIRFKQHNSGAVRSTKPKIPYHLIWTAAFPNKEKAFAFEKYLKSSSGYAFMKKRLV